MFIWTQDTNFRDRMLQTFQPHTLSLFYFYFIYFILFFFQDYTWLICALLSLFFSKVTFMKSPRGQVIKALLFPIERDWTLRIWNVLETTQTTCPMSVIELHTWALSINNDEFHSFWSPPPPQNSRKHQVSNPFPTDSINPQLALMQDDKLW